MSYERKCKDQCVYWYDRLVACYYDATPGNDCGREMIEATPKELRAELLERAEALDGVVMGPLFETIDVGSEFTWCVHRDGDDGIK